MPLILRIPYGKGLGQSPKFLWAHDLLGTRVVKPEPHIPAVVGDAKRKDRSAHGFQPLSYLSSGDIPEQDVIRIRTNGDRSPAIRRHGEIIDRRGMLSKGQEFAAVRDRVNVGVKRELLGTRQ